MLPYLILELANFHAGNTELIKELIDKYSSLEYKYLGIKFQIFKYDTIALENFSWYKTYQELFIDESSWNEIIELANKKIGQVWIDLFDTYGTTALKNNLSKVYGIKLQASVLNNLEVINALKDISLKDISIMINISGYEIHEIESFVTTFSGLAPKKLILQIGYQNYPTNIEDSSLNKIDAIRKAFPNNEICYADHIGAEEEFARDFPVYATLKGVEYIEKHVCLDRKNTKYDAFSSMEFDEMKKITEKLLLIEQCNNTKFITDKEKEYLEKSEQKVITGETIYQGQMISKSDIIYRRTDLPGLRLKDINKLQEEHYILKDEIPVHTTITELNYKKARIAVIVAGRMKSTRLKQKAILPIRGIPSVEMCLESCSKFPFIDDVILATSTLEEDAILGDYTLKGKAKFWKGDPDDVISRYLGACDKYNVDVVVRVTADCPLVSFEMAEILLKRHFETGSDYTGVSDCAVGSNSEVFNVEALRRVIKLLGKADHSEYMTWYMRNNKDIFKVDIIDLPPQYVRDYRLTLDYQEDLDMFEALLAKMEELKLEQNLVNVFKVLDEYPEIPKMNGHLTLKYKADKEFIEFLNKVTRIHLPK